MKLEDLQSYEILEKRFIDDIGCEGIRLRHKKTGARVALLSCNDDNKVFYIGFRTPPADSTGVAHITEHSVLCGSKEFPVKDPFVELAKGSLNTFLNAMTYPDKTVYPVASCNDTDFQNLIHVYLDAVFYPNTYLNESIFRQEGWHYEFDDEGKLFINGVVYNEMKGAFSSPDDVLSREILNSLYPDTAYGVESGGDPEVIPELTYEQFLDFHRAYYHPSNSYIYLYGDMDMAEKLDYIDKEYLSKFEYREVDSAIRMQPAFTEEKNLHKYCNLNEGENPDENTFLSLNYSIGNAIDNKTTNAAMQIIDYALTGNPGAPLKKTLVERGIGNDCYSWFDDGLLQPMFSIGAKDTQVDKADEFKDTVREVLEDIVENGFEKKSLLAAINHYEFRYREADFGNYPKGLIYGLGCFNTWLYDDSRPFESLELVETYKFLKESVESSYFENLVSEYLLDNTHSAFIILEPKVGIEEEKEAKLKEKLAQYQASLSEDELAKIKADYEKLKEFQERVDSPEDLARLPLLSREDLKREAEDFSNIEMTVDDTFVLRHDYQTNGISYMKLMFNYNELPGKLYPYLSLLKMVLGQIDTVNYSYADLNNDIDLELGSLNVGSDMYCDSVDLDSYKLEVVFKTKFLEGKEASAFKLIEEMMLNSKLDDTDRIFEILNEAKSQMQYGMAASGHHTAMERAGAGVTVPSRLNDISRGITFYKFLTELIENYDARKAEMVELMKEAAKTVFRPEYLMVDITASETAAKNIEGLVAGLKSKLYTDEVAKEIYVPELLKENEGLMTSGQVLYVCRAGNFARNGLEYTGALRVLKVILGYKYLWENVRVKGGAYGCMCNFSRDGMSYFVSYRDPNLSKTIDVYEKAAEAIENFDFDERTMTQFIIGTVSELDQPLTPALKGSRSLQAYMTHTSYDLIQTNRDQVLDAQPDDIRALGAYIRTFIDDNRLVVVGNAAKIRDEEKLFDSVSNMF